MRTRLLVALSLLVLLPLALLAWLGGRAARGEQARLRERFESLMTQRLTEVKRGMAETIATQERELAALLDSVMAPGQSLETQTPVHRTIEPQAPEPGAVAQQAAAPRPSAAQTPGAQKAS